MTFTPLHMKDTYCTFDSIMFLWRFTLLVTLRHSFEISRWIFFSFLNAVGHMCSSQQKTNHSKLFLCSSCWIWTVQFKLTGDNDGNDGNDGYYRLKGWFFTRAPMAIWYQCLGFSKWKKIHIAWNVCSVSRAQTSSLPTNIHEEACLGM